MKSGLCLLTGLATAVLHSLPTAAQPAPVAPPLQSQAEALVAKVGGRWGVLAWSIDGNRTLISINPNELFIPASNNKVFTSIWALDLFGPDHRFATELLITGPIENGVLRGDVVIRGSGDPSFGYPEFTTDPMEPLRIMARALAQRGVRRVEGDVVGDPFAFDTLLVGIAWPRDTGGGSAYYAPRVSGLPFHRNVISIRAVAGSGGATIELSPPVEVVPVRSRRSGGRAYAVRAPDNDTIEVRGAVSGRSTLYRVGVLRPALMTTDALRVALNEAGIEVAGQPRIGRTPEDARLVHRHLSLPLWMLIRKMNNESDNFFAEHVFKAAVREAIGVGSYFRGGPASALHFHEVAGIPLGELYQIDGSGLSLYNRASPNAMVRALIHAHNAPYSDAFHASLALAGERSGTLRRLFTGSPASGNLHAKTGYINDVRTLSGYVTAANGELIAFCFFYNGRGTSPARGVQMELGNLLASYGGAVSAAEASTE
ncbi:MAG TPA: D-alanyl-D-alanine carboxypeptidase/D-alanyl-D-alanine-endopeptidase [Longimicrobiaceae bacterium]